MAAMFLGGCGREAPVHHDRFIALGTLVEVTLYDTDEDLATRASRAVQQEMDAVHRTWHAWEPGPLQDINRRLPAGVALDLPPAMSPLLSEAQRMSRLSGGLFNPAIGRLVALWGFHSDELPQGPPPADKAIADLVAQHPTMDDLEITDTTVRSANPAVQLDFGAIAKGHAVDRAIARLRELGVRDAIVNAGGDLRAIGRHGDRPWRIGIRNPRGPGILASVEIQGDESVFTSGDYERFYVYDGRRYHHIIDPRTGYPPTAASSATVIGADGTHAEPGANALLIAGPGAWHRVARDLGVKYAMVVDSEGTVHMSPAMAARVRFETSPAPKVQVSDPL